MQHIRPTCCSMTGYGSKGSEIQYTLIEMYKLDSSNQVVVQMTELRDFID